MKNFGEWANGRHLIPEVMDKMREAVILEPHERVCTLFCVGCDKPRGECSCGCVMTEWRPVERVG